jgi:hypothetical protein
MWVRIKGGTDSEGTLLQLGTYSASTGSIYAVGFNASRQMTVVTIGRDTGPQSLSTIPSDTWTHVAYIYNGDGTSTFYINGQAKIDRVTHGGSLNVGVGGNAIYLGYGNWNSTTTNKYSNSWISDVAVYSRALTAGEVAAIYNSQRLVSGY